MNAKFLVLAIVMFSSVAATCIGQPQVLEGKTWKLDSYVNSEGNMVNILPDTEITARFEGGKVGGSAGCNSYFGSYTISGNSISIGTLTTTLMYCFPPEKMKQEMDYTAALKSATGFKVKGNTLVMTNAKRVEILIFTAA